MVRSISIASLLGSGPTVCRRIGIVEHRACRRAPRSFSLRVPQARVRDEDSRQREGHLGRVELLRRARDGPSCRPWSRGRRSAARPARTGDESRLRPLTSKSVASSSLWTSAGSPGGILEDEPDLPLAAVELERDDLAVLGADLAPGPRRADQVVERRRCRARMACRNRGSAGLRPWASTGSGSKRKSQAYAAASR